MKHGELLTRTADWSDSGMAGKEEKELYKKKEVADKRRSLYK